MSKIEVILNNKLLKIEKKTLRNNKENIEEIQLDTLDFGKEYESKIEITNLEKK